MDFRLCVLWRSTRQAFQTVPAEDLRAPFRARPSGMREASPEVHSTPTEVLRAARVGSGRCSKERAKTEGKRGGLKGWSKHQDKNSGTKIHLYLRSKTCMFFFCPEVLSPPLVDPFGRPRTRFVPAVLYHDFQTTCFYRTLQCDVGRPSCGRIDVFQRMLPRLLLERPTGRRQVNRC